MRLIKLFEQFVSEEVKPDNLPLSKITVPFEFNPIVNAQTLLNSEWPEFNTTIGFDDFPRNFSGWGTTGGVTPAEVDFLVDALDSPMSSDDPQHVKQWLQGNGFPGGGSGKNVALKDRVVKENGLWYPAVEQLRVKYNLDESFETLGSSVSKPELAEVKKLLLECYEFWHNSVNSVIMSNARNRTADATTVLMPNAYKEGDVATNEGVNVVPKGKSDLIQELRNKLINFEKKNEFDAMAIARLIYNDCADFMNKASIYSDKTKYGEPVAQPAAQSAPTNIIGTDTAAPGIADVIDPSKAPIAPVNPQ